MALESKLLSEFLPAEVASNLKLIIVSMLGGVVLFGLECYQHALRAPVDKMPTKKYIGWICLILIALPALGVVVTAVYLMNGDKISPILAFQIGLTSPALVQSMVIAAANKISTGGTAVTTHQ